VFVGLEGAPGAPRAPLHHPRFLPPEEAVRVVARAQKVAYVAAASEG
jgi:amidohydrolase